MYIYKYGVCHQLSVAGFADAFFSTFLRQQLAAAATTLKQANQFGATFTNVIHAELAEAGR